MNNSLIYPDWPAPANIKAISTTRENGFSLPPYESLNLATHVGDVLNTVNNNRDRLRQQANLPELPRWLNQTHGIHIINSQDWTLNSEADAILSGTPNHVCTIMTADCLPILLCNRQGDAVAAIHAGWRGLANGIIEHTITSLGCQSSDMIAWLGPAIGPAYFEVGTEVYAVFCQHSPQASQAFKQTDATHYLANIHLLAKQRLNKIGVTAIFGDNSCTSSASHRFFSYRRDGITGRMASMIWIEPK